MTRRVDTTRVARHHLAWESQPLVGPTPRARTYSLGTVLIALVAGILLGLLF